MIISSSLKNGISVDRSLCTSTYRDYSKTPYRNYGKTPCLLHHADLYFFRLEDRDKFLAGKLGPLVSVEIFRLSSLQGFF